MNATPTAINFTAVAPPTPIYERSSNLMKICHQFRNCQIKYALPTRGGGPRYINIVRLATRTRFVKYLFWYTSEFRSYSITYFGNETYVFSQVSTTNTMNTIYPSKYFLQFNRRSVPWQCLQTEGLNWVSVISCFCCTAALSVSFD